MHALLASSVGKGRKSAWVGNSIKSHAIPLWGGIRIILEVNTGVSTRQQTPWNSGHTCLSCSLPPMQATPALLHVLMSLIDQQTATVPPDPWSPIEWLPGHLPG